MTAGSVIKRLVQIVYRLTVGLAVLLIKAALLHICLLVTLILLTAAVVITTWRTYSNTASVGWTVLAAVSTLVICFIVVVVAHRVARDVLGLTSMSLQELTGLVVGKRPKCGRRDKQRRQSGESAGGTRHGGDPVILRRRVVQRTTLTDQNRTVPG